MGILNRKLRNNKGPQEQPGRPPSLLSRIGRKAEIVRDEVETAAKEREEWQEEVLSTALVRSAVDQETGKRNRYAVLIVLAAIVNVALVVIAATLLFGSPWAGIAVFMVLVAWIVYIYAQHEKALLKMIRARFPTCEELQRLDPQIRRLSRAMKTPMPKVFVVDDKRRNAFALGAQPSSSAVIFTTGLLQALDDYELEAVAAHELSHLVLGDTRRMIYATSVLGWAVGLFALIGAASFGLIAIGIGTVRFPLALPFGVMAIIAGAVLFVVGQTWFLIGQLAHLALSRQREWLADALAAETTSRPLALAHALEALAHGKVNVGGTNPFVSAICIAGAGKDTEDRSAWFSTHPDLDDRIERLYRYAGKSRSPRPRSSRRAFLNGLRSTRETP